MKYVVHSRVEIAQIDPPESHIIISISTPQGLLPVLPQSPVCAGVLELSFHDANRLGRRPPDAMVRFSAAEANRILDFWLDHQDVETCYVHCDGGRCRSPAVAAALQKLEIGDDALWFKGKYHPNTLVYSTLLEEGYRRTLNLV